MKVSNTMKALGLLSTKLEKPITVNVIATFDHKEQEFFDLDLPTKEIVNNEDLIIKFIIFSMRLDPKDRLVKLSLSFKGDLDFLDQFQGITTKFNLAKEKEDNQELLKIIKEIKEWLSSNIEDNYHENDLVEDNIKLLQYILELELCRAKKKNYGIEVKPYSC